MNLFQTSFFQDWGASLTLFFLTIGLLLVLRKLVWSNVDRFHMPATMRTLLQATQLPMQWFVLFISLNISFHASPDYLNRSLLVQTGLKVMVILCGLWVIDRSIYAYFTFNNGNGHTSTRAILRTLFRVISFALGLLMILDSFGVSITPLLASLGVGSLAVALALQEPLSNFFNGLYLVTDKPIRVGDYVRLDTGIEGSIVQVGWRSTQVMTPQNNMVIIPNSKVATSQIMNFDLNESEMAVIVPMGVAYDSDLSQVEKVTLEVAQAMQRTVPGAVKHYQPVLRFQAFNSSSIDFNVTLRAEKFECQGLLRHEFMKAIHQRFLAEKIEIPFPQQVVHEGKKV